MSRFTLTVWQIAGNLSNDLDDDDDGDEDDAAAVVGDGSQPLDASSQISIDGKRVTYICMSSEM